MREVWLSTLRTRGLRPVSLTAALGLYGLCVVFLVGDSSSRSLVPLVCIHALLAANGLIGVDVSSGSIQLLLARPLTRARYLAGRLLGVATLTTAFAVAAFATGAVMHRPAPEDFLVVSVAGLTASLWTVVLVFFFSTFLPDRADSLAAVGLFVASLTLYSIRIHLEQQWAAAAVGWLWDNVACLVSLTGPTLSPAALTDLARWASNVAVALLAAVVIFDRRQFGYAD